VWIRGLRFSIGRVAFRAKPAPIVILVGM